MVAVKIILLFKQFYTQGVPCPSTLHLLSVEKRIRYCTVSNQQTFAERKIQHMES